MPDVRATLRQRGIQPDSAAGTRFRAAAVAQHAGGIDEVGDGSGDDHPAVAAAALLEMAAAGARSELMAYLTPDPDTEASAWTVVCYQVGDVSPSAIRDFSSPDDALATLAQCDDPNHAAAELLCSTADGLRWTAVTRAGERLAFQLPTVETSTPGGPGAIDREEALAAWHRQLRAWARGEDDRWGRGSEDLARSLEALHRRLDVIDERLTAVAHTISLLTDRVTERAGADQPVEDDPRPGDDLLAGDDQP